MATCGLTATAMMFTLLALTTAVHGQSAGAKGEKVDAAELYKTKCMVCHLWVHGSSVKEVSNTITNGVQGTAMMPFKGQLSDAEIAALAKYVRQFDKKLKPAK
jgi:mono/diheme cytochrome c family protein